MQPLTQRSASKHASRRLLSEDKFEAESAAVLTYDDCTYEPDFSHSINEKKREKLRGLTRGGPPENAPLSQKINDILKFQQRHMLNVDRGLQAERQRGFRINMENLPEPDKRWKNNPAVKRRLPQGKLSISRNMFSRERNSLPQKLPKAGMTYD